MIKRLGIYLNEMFPITSFVGTLLTGISIQLVYMRLYGIPAQFHYQIILSAIVLMSVTLLIRVMDEFKDYPDDLKNYPNRPLPSGRVKREDLKVLGAIALGIVPVLSLTSMPLFLFSLVVLGYTFLMLKWFFIEEKMRKSLILALVSHHPIVFLNFAYLIFGMVETFPGVDWNGAWYVFPIGLIFTNWEISRKIRMPEQETAYVTYSQIFGPRKAITVALVLQGMFITAAYAIFNKLGSPMVLQIVFGALMLLMSIPYFRFLFTLKLKGPLKANAESQILVVIGFLLAAACL